MPDHPSPAAAPSPTMPVVVRWVLLGVAGLYLAVYLVSAWQRLHYPFELEWMEGGTVDHIRRLLAGQPLYVEPSLEFIPYAYTPLYFYLGALVSKVLGAGFLPLRLISFAASLGCLAVIAGFVKRETRSLAAGFLAAGLYAATYELSSEWFDLARVDSLFLLLLLAALYLLRSHEDVPSLALAGGLAWLAFFTKQTALFVALPFCVYCLWTKRGWAKLAFPVTLFGLVAVSTVIGNAATGGWYGYYVFTVPREHPLYPPMLLDFWIRDIFRSLSIVLGLSAFYLLHTFSRRDRKDIAFFGAWFVGLVGAAWYSRSQIGGDRNALLPAYAALAIGAALAVDLLWRWQPDAHTLTSAGGELDQSQGEIGIRGSGRATGSPLRDGQEPLVGANRWLARCRECRFNLGFSLDYGRRTRDIRAALAISLICLAQFLTLFYYPTEPIPTPADVDGGRAFVQMLRDIDGDVFVPGHAFIPSLAGKPDYLQDVAMVDIFRTSDGPIKQRLEDEVRAAVRSHRFKAIVAEAGWWFLDAVRESYDNKGPVPYAVRGRHPTLYLLRE